MQMKNSQKTTVEQAPNRPANDSGVVLTAFAQHMIKRFFEDRPVRPIRIFHFCGG
jgi:hypothetical protein